MPQPLPPDASHAEARRLALEKLREFETAYLGDPVHGRINPFRRPGLIASDIAWACGFVSAQTTASGRAKADVPAARRLLKELVAEGLVESTGKHRTLQAGSQGKECFAPAGFLERLAAATP